MKTIHEIDKKSLTYILYDRIENGEERTIDEWARELDTFPDNIQSALGRARKMNVHLHPVGTITNPNGGSKKGIVRDIMKKEEWMQEVYERRMTNAVLPGIKDFYRKTETATEEFPNLRHYLTIAFNKVYSYIHATHDMMRLSAPKVPEVHGLSPEEKEKVLENILE